jgi:uncharacterized membrane protein YgcG
MFQTIKTMAIVAVVVIVTVFACIGIVHLINLSFPPNRPAVRLVRVKVLHLKSVEPHIKRYAYYDNDDGLWWYLTQIGNQATWSPMRTAPDPKQILNEEEDELEVDNDGVPTSAPESDVESEPSTESSPDEGSSGGSSEGGESGGGESGGGDWGDGGAS